MIPLLKIDEENRAVENDFLAQIPSGIVQWTVYLLPNKHRDIFANYVEVFSDIVILDDFTNYEKNFLLKSLSHLNQPIQCKTLSYEIEKLKNLLENYNDENVKNLCSLNPLVSAQYALHVLRKCDFFGSEYSNFLILYCTPGMVTGKLRSKNNKIFFQNDTMEANFKNLITDAYDNIQYISKIYRFGLKKFIIEKTLHMIQKNYPELLQVFPIQRCQNSLN